MKVKEAKDAENSLARRGSLNEPNDYNMQPTLYLILELHRPPSDGHLLRMRMGRPMAPQMTKMALQLAVGSWRLGVGSW